MVKLVRLKLVNFIGIYLGLGLNEIEIDFSKSTNNIILILGNNGSGKTTIINEITPLPLERMGSRNSSRIIDGEIGIKELDLLVDEFVLYKIKIIYDPSKTTKCYIDKYIDGKVIELNPNGNVSSYLEIIEHELKMKKNYTNIGYLCGSDSTKNFVSMKPTERNNYISEWMPEISEFVDAYRNSMKLMNKLKRDINNYNKEIGAMTSIDYELELNQVNANISNLSDELKELESQIVQLKTYNSQLEKYVKTDRQIEDMKFKFFEAFNVVKNLSDRFYEYWNKHPLPETTSGKEFQDTLNIMEKDINRLQKDIERIEEKTNLLSAEIDSYSGMLSTDEKISNADLSTIIQTIEANDFTLVNINQTIKEFQDKYGNEEETRMSISVISDLKIIVEILTNKFIQLNNLVPLDTIADFDKLSDKINSSVSDIKKIDALIENTTSKLTQTNNEIYKYEKGGLDEQILMKRPQFCQTEYCGVVEELMKYLDPKENIKELYSESEKLQKQIFDYNQRKDEISEFIENYRKIHVIYVEICDYLHQNCEKIAKFPIHFQNFFLESPISIYTHMNDLKALIQDFTEIMSLYDKRDELDTTNSELKNIRKLIVTNKQISENLEYRVREYEKLREKRTELYSNLEKVNDTYQTYRNAQSLLEERDKSTCMINENIINVMNYKKQLLNHLEVTYIYNSNKNYIETVMEKRKLEIETSLMEFNKKRDEMTTFYISKKQIEKMRNEIQEKFDKVEILNNIWSPKTGYPSLKIESFLNELTISTNEDLENMWGSEMKIEEFIINESDFNIVVNRSGTNIEDASLCSQGETKTINTAISFSIIKSNINEGGYDILRLDEVDGVFDQDRRIGFLDMIQNRVNEMGVNTCVIITHNNEFEDIPCDVILLRGADANSLKMKNKNILYKY